MPSLQYLPKYSKHIYVKRRHAQLKYTLSIDIDSERNHFDNTDTLKEQIIRI